MQAYFGFRIYINILTISADISNLTLTDSKNLNVYYNACDKRS